MSGQSLAAAGAALLLALTAPAVANDTTAEIGAGGLVYGRNDVVAIADETLYLSIEKVRVDYVFRNNADYDVETVVAFPMPDIVMDPFSDISIPRLDDNFMGFTVEVDGQPIQPELQQRAWAYGIDVTDVLTAAGLPVTPLDEYGDGLDSSHLTQEQIADLVARGMVLATHDPETGQYEQGLTPVWTLKSAYWWRMKFPAKAEIKVHHEYTPAVGGTVDVYFAEDEGKDQLKQYEDRYCIDDSFLSALRKRQEEEKAKSGYGFTQRWLSYVLSTGGNWGEPIGHLRIIVDKGSAENLVSFCGEGVKKTGPTTFEMEKENFWPEKDFDVLLAMPVRP
ncbi:MAG: DUF4424 domain-containing protein [Oricola sp.]